MIDAEYVLDLADKVTRCVLGRYADMYTREDWEDARQAACAGILSAAQKEHEHEVYLYQAGKYEIYVYLRSTWNPRRCNETPLNYVDIDEHRMTAYALQSEWYRWSQVSLDELAMRMKKTYIDGSLAKIALDDRRIERYIQYLRLFLEGYTLDGICQEMDVSKQHLHTLRMHLCKRLQFVVDDKERQRKQRKKPIIDGMSIEDVIAALGVCRSFVRIWLRENWLYSTMCETKPFYIVQPEDLRTFLFERGGLYTLRPNEMWTPVVAEARAQLATIYICANDIVALLGFGKNSIGSLQRRNKFPRAALYHQYRRSDVRAWLEKNPRFWTPAARENL